MAQKQQASKISGTDGEIGWWLESEKKKREIVREIQKEREKKQKKTDS